jgi:hypothetical protein
MQREQREHWPSLPSQPRRRGAGWSLRPVAPGALPQAATSPAAGAVLQPPLPVACKDREERVGGQRPARVFGLSVCLWALCGHAPPIGLASFTSVHLPVCLSVCLAVQPPHPLPTQSCGTRKKTSSHPPSVRPSACQPTRPCTPVLVPLELRDDVDEAQFLQVLQEQRGASQVVQYEARRRLYGPIPAGEGAWLGNSMHRP